MKDEAEMSAPMLGSGSRPGSSEYVHLRMLADDLKASKDTISKAAAGVMLATALDLYVERWEFWRDARNDADEWERTAKRIAAESGQYENVDMIRPE